MSTPWIKLLSFTLLTLTTLSCLGCRSTANQDNKIHILTSIIADIVNRVGGDFVEVTSLIPIGTDPHDFSPQPKDAAAITDADIIFINGAGLEDNLMPLIESAEGLDKVIEVSQGIKILFSTAKDGKTQYQDPHTWMDPRNILIWLNNITEALVEIDPSHVDEYQANTADFVLQIEDLDFWIRSQVEIIPENKRMIVSDHTVLGYFNAAYGFIQLGTITGSSSTEASPSAQDIAILEELIKQYDVAAIFISEMSSFTLADQISLDTGIQVVQIYHGSLGLEGGPAATYLEFMRYNVTAIVEALR
jgi:manganese/iron transport system substrate-binding protein